MTWTSTRSSSFKCISITNLTHYRPAMPFGNRKIYFRGSFQFIMVTIQKISPLLETWNLIISAFSETWNCVFLRKKSFHYLVSRISLQVRWAVMGWISKKMNFTRFEYDTTYDTLPIELRAPEDLREWKCNQLDTSAVLVAYHELES